MVCMYDIGSNVRSLVMRSMNHLKGGVLIREWIRCVDGSIRFLRNRVNVLFDKVLKVVESKNG
jgi:hypothetical protein